MLKQAEHYVVVLVTCSSVSEAAEIARAVVVGRLAACVNVCEAPLRSIYWWEGKVEETSEFLLLIKTERRHLADLRAEVERLHSYEVPEFLVLPVDGGSPGYLAWLSDSLKSSPEPRRGP